MDRVLLAGGMNTVRRFVQNALDGTYVSGGRLVGIGVHLTMHNIARP